jgi:hypothetical protein
MAHSGLEPLKEAKMIEFTFTTKCFGNITVIEKGGHGNIDAIYNNHEINIFLNDYSHYGDKIKICLDWYRRLERTIQQVHILLVGSYSTIRLTRLSNIVSM